jgi:hypothetical protein
MDDSCCDKFQNTVSTLLVRHRSILDVLSKFQETNARVNRSIVKAVTSCGCLRIRADKQDFPTDILFEDITKYMDDHLEGELCSSCREIIESELGRNIFYFTAICDLLDFSLADILESEGERLSALGRFTLT